MPVSLDLKVFLLSTWASMLVSFIPFYIYRIVRGVSGDSQIKNTILILAPLITIIIQFIGSNFALSLGLVGSLSIIRFRTAIKSAKDLLFLLWSISIGLGCGSNNLIHTILGSASISIFLIAINKITREETHFTNSQLSMQVDSDFDHKHVEDKNLKLMSCSVSKDNKELIFIVINSNEMSLEKINRLNAAPGVQRVNYINV